MAAPSNTPISPVKFGPRLPALVLAAFLFGSAPAAVAQEAALPSVQARLIAETGSVSPGGHVRVGLHQKIPDGWHTYWRNPGDSGLPTRIRWRLPKGFEAGDIQWPQPRRLPYGPLVNYGYKDEVLLMTRIAVPKEATVGEKIAIKARAEWLMCSDICIPERRDLSVGLLIGGGQPIIDRDRRELFSAARQRHPMPLLGVARTELGSNNLRLHIDARSNRLDPAVTAYFFPFKDGMIEYRAPQAVERRGNERVLLLRPESEVKNATSLDGVLVIGRGNMRRAYTVMAPLTKSQ